MNIIKSLPVASRLNPGLADDLEVFFPEWLSTLLTFYNEARSGGDFAFHMMNTCGSGSSYTVGAYDFCRTRHYYGNGYHTLLSFYGGNRLFGLDWEEMFRARYGYDPSLYDKISLLDYVSRMDNKRAPYDALNNNLSGCFRALTGDPDVFISLGSWGTYIALDSGIFWKHEEHEEKWRMHF